jgi:hypothetical protein
LYVANLWKRYSDIIKAQSTQNISGLPSLLAGDTCLIYAGNMTDFTKDVNQFFKDIQDSALLDENLFKFEQTANGFQQLLTNLAVCLMEYESLLVSVKTWTDEVSSSLVDKSNTVDLSSASQLYTTLYYECYMTSYYFTYFGPSLQGLADHVSEMYDMSVSLDDIDSSVFSTLTSINDNLQASIKDAYHKLFDKFGQINNYMYKTDKIADKFLRKLHIWRYPYINLENRQVGL